MRGGSSYEMQRKQFFMFDENENVNIENALT